MSYIVVDGPVCNAWMRFVESHGYRELARLRALKMPEVKSHNTAGGVRSQDEARIVRDLPALAERVLIIGLDGATFDVLEPMLDAGRMPHLRAFLDRGCHGILESTKPPITPAAWTTFMTGKSPGNHGIIDFERYDARTHRLSINSTRSIAHVRTIFDILGDKGLKVGVINVPMTYPPRPVNGCLITGFDTPSTRVSFTHPPELKDEILRRWPDYTFKTTWKHAVVRRQRVFRENLDAIGRTFTQGAEVTRFCGERFGWEALMVVFKLVDNLQHKAWRYLDPKFNGNHPEYARRVGDCFKVLDDALGNLFLYAEERNAAVFIMSDHGHGSLEGKAQPNLLLKEWGYLSLKSAAVRSRTRLRRLLVRTFGAKKGKFSREDRIEHELPVRFAQTRACVMHAGMYGFLYINLKGRQPDGIVEPADYELLRDELREKFLGARVNDPAGGAVNIFTDVYKPEDLYGCSRDGREWMPDLLLVPAEGLSVVRRIRGWSPVQWLAAHKIEGTHRLDGMFAAAGAGIARGRKPRQRIVDCAPTILAMLGLRIPDDIEGGVMQALFDESLHFETESVATGSVVASTEEVYSDDEMRAITERLADLGYLE